MPPRSAAHALEQLRQVLQAQAVSAAASGRSSGNPDSRLAMGSKRGRRA